MISSKISGAFPPPAFLDIPYAGLSISDTMMRCIRLEKKHGYLEVKSFAERAIPPGCIIGGNIENTAEVAKLLEGMRAEMSLEYVKVSMPEEKAYLFKIEIPKVNKHDVREAIEFKIEENVPLPASELIFDYTLVDPYSDSEHLDVVVSALPASVVDTYVEMVTRAHVMPLSLEIESQAVARSVLEKGHVGTTLITHFNKEKLSLYIVRDRIVHFTSTVTISSSAMAESVLSEIRKVTAYWHSLQKESGESHMVDLIVACGDIADHSIPAFVSTRIGLPMKLANVWSNVCDISIAVPPIPFEKSLTYAPAVGLALPMNLLL